MAGPIPIIFYMIIILWCTDTSTVLRTLVNVSELRRRSVRSYFNCISGLLGHRTPKLSVLEEATPKSRSRKNVTGTVFHSSLISNRSGKWQTLERTLVETWDRRIYCENDVFYGYYRTGLRPSNLRDVVGCVNVGSVATESGINHMRRLQKKVV